MGWIISQENLGRGWPLSRSALATSRNSATLRRAVAHYRLPLYHERGGQVRPAVPESRVGNSIAGIFVPYVVYSPLNLPLAARDCLA